MSTEVGAMGGTPIPRPTAPARGAAAATSRSDAVGEDRLASLRAPDPTRKARVDAARERLEQGLLDTMTAYRETARRMLARRVL